MPTAKQLPLNVLVVDDDRTLREAVSAALSALELSVQQAGTLAEAQRIINSGDPPLHMVFADLKLPDGDGLEIVTLVNERYPRALSAVMTGYASIEAAASSIRLGAYDFLVKPLTLEQFTVTARNMAHHIRVRDKSNQAETQLLEIRRKLERDDDERLNLRQFTSEVMTLLEALNDKVDVLTTLVLEGLGRQRLKGKTAPQLRDTLHR